MRILADFHHSSLFSSFLYTLESRLGFEVFRQIGEKWFKNGYWRINRQRDTIQQYLGTYGYQPTDGTPSLNNIAWLKDDVYYSRDPNTGQIHKAITFDSFMAMDFDVVIASIPNHIKPFKELAKKKGAKFVLQMGNNWDISPFQLYEETRIDNLMASIYPRNFGVKNAVFYHQEFDTRFFNYEKPPENKTICNYMNVLKNYPEALDLFLALEQEMPDYTFKMYGSQNRDGCITGVDNLANSMKQARWVFHVKPGGDGYGHCLMNALAVGRSLIINRSYYNGELGGTFLKSDNSIDVEGVPIKQLAQIIRNNEQKNEDMGLNSYRLFSSEVDFEKDSKKLDIFFKNLL
jgi:glycosyltransferase involved in cell wall biosynthesis